MPRRRQRTRIWPRRSNGYNAGVSGRRLIIGIILMGLILPLIIFLLLGLTTLSQFFTIAASTFLAWGVGDFLATILEQPRLKGRSPQGALREDWERRAGEEPPTPSRSSSAATDRS